MQNIFSHIKQRQRYRFDKIHESRPILGSGIGIIVLSYFLLPAPARVLSGSVLSVTLFLYLIMRNRALTSQLNEYKKKMSHQTLRAVQIGNNLSEVELELRKLATTEHTPQLKRIIKNLSSSRTQEQDWSAFDSCTTATFNKQFLGQFPNLTISEQRLASLVNLNLTNSEIANILHIETNSVKVAKYRLKKKLELRPNQDIHCFLRKFN